MRRNKYDWVDIRIGHFNRQNATARVLPKLSFVSFPQTVEGGTRPTVEPLTRVRSCGLALCLVAGFPSKEGSSSVLS